MARSLLECEGIPALIMSDDAGGTEPQFQFIRGVRLMVLQRDVERAREILDTEGSGEFLLPGDEP
jgi:hypothetical protein